MDSLSVINFLEEQAPSSGEPILLPILMDALDKGVELGILIANAELEILARNQKILELYELPSNKLNVGDTIHEAIAIMCERGNLGKDTEADQLANALQQRAKNYEYFFEDISRKRDDARYIKTQRIFTENGTIVFLAQDETKRRDQAHLLESAMSLGGAGSWRFSFHTRKFEFSESLRKRMTKRELDLINEKGLTAIVHPDYHDMAMDIWYRAIKTGEIQDAEYRVILDKEGTLDLRFIGQCHYTENNEPSHFSTFVIELTEEKLKERRLKAEKQDYSKVLAKTGEQIAKLAHEIRTPLNGILGMAEALLYLEESMPVRGQLEVIRNSGQQLMTLVNDHLSIAKMQSDHVKIVDEAVSPRRLILSSLDLWEDRAVKNGTQLTSIIDQSLPDILMLDPLRYQQCLNNFLSNAVKFTQNGRIRVIAKLVESGGMPWFVTAIQDTGIGMTEDEQNKVFAAYAQANSEIEGEFGGTGLGLNIVKDLVERMGGKITLRSEKGKGSTFAFTLPVKRREGERRSMQRPTPERRDDTPTADISPQSFMTGTSTTQGAAKKEENYSSLRVLVAEDNFTNQLVVKSLLQKQVKSLDFVDNGEEALAWLQTNKADVILMDIHMPGMDGIETTIQIRASEKPYKNIPIIALTADPEYQQARICRNIGMDHAVPKPISMPVLFKAFKEVFEIKPIHALLSHKIAG